MESVGLSHNILKNSAALVHGGHAEPRPARAILRPSIKAGPEAEWVASLSLHRTTAVRVARQSIRSC